MDIKPTRSELIKLKQRIKTAQMGYQILKRKRDGLILSFFEILKSAKNERAELNQLYNAARRRMDIARMLESDIKLRALAIAIAQTPELQLSQKSVMGVPVTEVASQTSVRKNVRGYGTIGMSFAVDDAVEGYEEVVDKIINVAGVENSMKRLLEEIEKTKRRVNALEFEVIPKLDEQKSFISLRLEEMERETIYRTKRMKKKSK